MYNYTQRMRSRQRKTRIGYLFGMLIVFLAVSAVIVLGIISTNSDSRQTGAIYFNQTNTIYLDAGQHFESFAWHGDTLWVATSNRDYNELPNRYKITAPAAPSGEIIIQEQ